MTDENCVFCKIVSGEISCKKVYEDKHILAFEDIRPVFETHILFIPKLHIARLDEVNSTNSEHIAKLVEAISVVAKEKSLDKSGFKTKVNVGTGGGQEVFHLHFHVLAGKQLK